MTDQLKEALKSMNRRPVAYNPVYATLTGSVTGGILLSQLIYWAAAMNWEEFYKTNVEIMRETGLTEDELRLAKKRLEKYVEIMKKGTPCRTWYKLDIEIILANLSSTGETPQLDAGKPRNQYRGNPATIYTENNTEIKTDILGAGAPEAAPKPVITGAMVNQLLSAYEKVNPDYESFYQNNTQRAAAKWLIEKFGLEDAIKKVKFLEISNVTQFVTKATTPCEYKRNMAKIIAHWQTVKEEKKGALKIGRTAEGVKIVATPTGWVEKDTSKPVKVEEVISEEEFTRRRNALWAERTKACGKCRDGFLMSDENNVTYKCECIKDV